LTLKKQNQTSPRTEAIIQYPVVLIRDLGAHYRTHLVFSNKRNNLFRYQFICLTGSECAEIISKSKGCVAASVNERVGVELVVGSVTNSGLRNG